MEQKKYLLVLYLLGFCTKIKHKASGCSTACNFKIQQFIIAGLPRFSIVFFSRRPIRKFLMRTPTQIDRKLLLGGRMG